MNINEPQQACFCPQCGSALVDFSELGDAGARCNACAWTGRKSELLSTPFSHDMGPPDEVAQRFVTDLRNMLSESFVIPFGRFLNKWGFLPEDQTEMGKVLSRYVTAVARSAVRVVFQERAAIEKEKASARRPA